MRIEAKENQRTPQIKKKNMTFLLLPMDAKAGADATNAIQKPEATEDEAKGVPLMSPDTNKNVNPRKKIDAAEENANPEESANHLPFTPAVKPLTNAIRHPKIMTASVIVNTLEA